MCIPFLKEMGLNVIHHDLAVLKEHQFRVNVKDDTFPSEGYANIEPNTDCEVEGFIVTIDKNTEYLVDEYEGFPLLYFKKTVKVVTKDNLQECTVYYGNPEYTSLADLQLTAIQKQRISWGAKYLSNQYQKKVIAKYFIDSP